ncbi:MAG: hypothetical protein KAH84_09480 [Thiomargarita sp.]|nr:hypothetical protein [Thiomargarita sp.]
MIEKYFLQIESLIQEFVDIDSYSINKKVYNYKQGFISGSILFKNGDKLEFVEVKDSGIKAKLKYRYQYMNENGKLIFRYDNAPHHKHIKTFPHHKHIGEKVEACEEPILSNILLEIGQEIKQS